MLVRRLNDNSVLPVDLTNRGVQPESIASEVLIVLLPVRKTAVVGTGVFRRGRGKREDGEEKRDRRRGGGEGRRKSMKNHSPLYLPCCAWLLYCSIHLSQLLLSQARRQKLCRTVNRSHPFGSFFRSLVRTPLGGSSNCLTRERGEEGEEEEEEEEENEEERKRGKEEEGKREREEERKRGRGEERKRGREEERKRGRKEERKRGREEERKRGREEKRKRGRHAFMRPKRKFGATSVVVVMGTASARHMFAAARI
jgi:hypothetical protein